MVLEECRARVASLTRELALVSVSGELDLYASDAVKRGIHEADAVGADTVVVDLSEISFIDSTALGVLVGGVKRLRPNGGRLSIVSSDRNITKIFEITGLDRVFTIYPSRDEAVSKLKAAADTPPA